MIPGQKEPGCNYETRGRREKGSVTTDQHPTQSHPAPEEEGKGRRGERSFTGKTRTPEYDLARATICKRSGTGLLTRGSVKNSE
jgi:hypothetical protein